MVVVGLLGFGGLVGRGEDGGGWVVVVGRGDVRHGGWLVVLASLNAGEGRKGLLRVQALWHPVRFYQLHHVGPLLGPSDCMTLFQLIHTLNANISP